MHLSKQIEKWIFPDFEVIYELSHGESRLIYG